MWSEPQMMRSRLRTYSVQVVSWDCFFVQSPFFLEEPIFMFMPWYILNLPVISIILPFAPAFTMCYDLDKRYVTKPYRSKSHA